MQLARQRFQEQAYWCHQAVMDMINKGHPASAVMWQEHAKRAYQDANQTWDVQVPVETEL